MSTVKGDHIITRIPTSTYTLKWTIDKIAKLKSETTVKSPKFYPMRGTEWYSELVKSSSVVRWKIRSDGKQNILVHHDISIEDYNGKILLAKSLKKEYSRNNGSCLLLDDSDQISLHDSEDVITFVCHMTITGYEIKSEITELQPRIHDSAYNLKKLSDDLKTMYGDAMYSDVCLRVDGNVFRAHKALLRARSPVFAKMFDHEMKEKETNEINITDLESNVLKQFVSFLYTGTVLDESFDSVLHLFYAADKYDVTDLRLRCADILLAGITVENACQVLACANRHRDDSLKKSAMTFVETHLEPVFETDGWKELLKSEPSLAAEITDNFVKKRKLQNKVQIEETAEYPKRNKLERAGLAVSDSKKLPASVPDKCPDSKREELLQLPYDDDDDYYGYNDW